MLSETLTEGLDRYAIGPKLRALRLKKKIGLVELGQHSGLSPAMISKIERGHLYPTLPTLLRLALVFSVGLEYFFTESQPQPVFAIVRRADRLQFPARGDMAKEDAPFTFESLDYPALERRLNAYLAEFAAQDPGPDDRVYHSHEGVEFLYVMDGTLLLYFDDEAHTLEAEDSVYFDSTVRHAYARTGKKSCRAIVVTVP